MSIQFSRLEVQKHHKTLLDKTMQSETELAALIETVFSSLSLFDENTIRKRFMRNAFESMHKIDKTDAPFLALALQENCGIWSDDKHFQQQKLAKIWTTEQLAKML